LSAMTTLKTWKIWSPKKFKTGQWITSNTLQDTNN
jgi:hypothetical protein